MLLLFSLQDGFLRDEKKYDPEDEVRTEVGSFGEVWERKNK